MFLNSKITKENTGIVDIHTELYKQSDTKEALGLKSRGWTNDTAVKSTCYFYR